MTGAFVGDRISRFVTGQWRSSTAMEDDSHGGDTDAHSNGSVDRQRLYQLIRESDEMKERTFEITLLARGVKAYVFAFG